MDDVWGDDDEIAPQEELNREAESRRQVHWNTGYREGLEEGKQLTVQEGFNEGFKAGGVCGKNWGWLRAASVTLKHLRQQQQPTAQPGTPAEAALLSYAALQQSRQQRGELREATCQGVLQDLALEGKEGSDGLREGPQGPSTDACVAHGNVDNSTVGFDLGSVLAQGVVSAGKQQEMLGKLSQELHAAGLPHK